MNPLYTDACFFVEMKRIFSIVLVIVCMLVLVSCKGSETMAEASMPPEGSSSEETAPDITAIPTPAATPIETQSILPTEAPISEAQFQEEFLKYFNASILEGSLEHADKDYTVLAANVEFYDELRDKLETELKTAADLAAVLSGGKAEVRVEGLSTYMTMTIAPKLAAAEKLDFSMFPAEIRIDGKNMEVVFDFTDCVKVFKGLEPEDTEAYLNLRVRYGYMITVYDEKGELLTGEQEEIELPEWIFPLPKYTRFRDTWFANRDKGKRRHLGTDISAPENTEIYSCTDAEVIYVGTGRLAGNCVYTRDADGNEYMYCHMVRVTDFLKVGDKVKQGDLIGHVGNTGNSAVNHLHLTVILRDGRHLHTFPYLKETWDAGRIKKNSD